MRTFKLIRHDDISGVSGSGIVATGCEFENRRCVMQWEGKLQSLAVYDHIEMLLAIHGHGGKSEVLWD